MGNARKLASTGFDRPADHGSRLRARISRPADVHHLFGKPQVLAKVKTRSAAPMRRPCMLRHLAGEKSIWNEGLFFSTCQHCGRDLVRPLSGKWTPVPKGLRVAWRTRAEQQTVNGSKVSPPGQNNRHQGRHLPAPANNPYAVLFVA
ncbi:MAG TPA: hypothetical protein VEZ48_02300 [Sphingomonadaceae bacterium]|nr:hypothetical protein [Sphingomonadaceae bacterium]